MNEEKWDVEVEEDTFTDEEKEEACDQCETELPPGYMEYQDGWLPWGEPNIRIRRWGF